MTLLANARQSHWPFAPSSRRACIRPWTIAQRPAEVQAITIFPSQSSLCSRLQWPGPLCMTSTNNHWAAALAFCTYPRSHSSSTRLQLMSLLLLGSLSLTKFRCLQVCIPKRHLTLPWSYQAQLHTQPICWQPMATKTAENNISAENKRLITGMLSVV